MWWTFKKKEYCLQDWLRKHKGLETENSSTENKIVLNGFEDALVLEDEWSNI